MEIVEGRPVIQGQDYPLTVFNALHSTAQAWRDNRPPREVFDWVGKARPDAYGSIRSGFAINPLDEIYRPDAEVVIYVWPEQLEFSLVAYGCKLLEQGGPAAIEEVDRADALLSELDRATGRNREQIQQLTDILISICLDEAKGIPVGGFGPIGTSRRGES